ncbi:transglutaminase-like domain-containing protein [Flavobacterium tructae]|uniref:transglutaminase-like domain-containing protein n=1 Tax=Flavobacterium tructae TaxID=1114873 RepID=UPI0035A8EC7C
MDIDNLLQRNILGGQEYEPLFPEVSCDKTNLGNGNTFDTVRMIKQMVIKYNHQTKEVAKLLQQSSLKETCDRIYWFLYNHIQYKADGMEQMLRSPACTFKMRAQGVDCKTYSIFASSLLVNMGIRHYIRQIKQPSFRPDLYTHVYVIVPLNQESGDIKEGYFIIDGTTSTNREPIHIMAHDTEVNLPHFGLNAPKTNRKGIAKKSRIVAKKTAMVAKKNSNLPVYLGIGALLGVLFLKKSN